MALTGRRWVVAAILGCLTAVVVYWPGPEGSPPRSTGFAFPEETHRGTEFRDHLVREAGSAYAVLRLRDLVLQSLERARDSGPITLWLSTGPLPDARSRVARMTASVIAFLAPVPSADPVQTVIISERGAVERGLGAAVPLMRDIRGSWYLMPPSTNGRICLVVAQKELVAPLERFLADTTHAPAGEGRAALLRVLGPCAFYNAFGRPGPLVEHWLRGRNFDFTARAGWDEEMRSEQRGALSLQDWFDAYSGNMSIIRALSIASSRVLEMGLISLPARACAHRKLAQCHTVVFANQDEPPPPLGGRYAMRRKYWWRDEPNAGLLSELVRLQGRERFVRFWRSDQTVEAAFTAAFGTSIEEWTHRWIVGQLDQPKFGPAVRWTSVGVGLLLALALVTVASLVVTRRQVG